MLMINQQRLRRDLVRSFSPRYEQYWRGRNTRLIPPEIFETRPKIFLEIGSGTGGFLLSLARQYPDVFFVGIERCRMRGTRLVKRAGKASLANVVALRGNAIPALIHGIPSRSIDRVYILYPCPWPKNSQRRNRWYTHPIMSHLVRILKVGGALIWASDQEFYIREAHFVCEHHYSLRTVKVGELSASNLNDLSSFPQGRTKFEAEFLARGVSCFELIAIKEADCNPHSP